jgi:hypothetical protein
MAAGVRAGCPGSRLGVHSGGRRCLVRCPLCGRPRTLGVHGVRMGVRMAVRPDAQRLASTLADRHAAMLQPAPST